MMGIWIETINWPATIAAGVLADAIFRWVVVPLLTRLLNWSSQRWRSRRDAVHARNAEMMRILGDDPSKQLLLAHVIKMHVMGGFGFTTMGLICALLLSTEFVYASFGYVPKLVLTLVSLGLMLYGSDELRRASRKNRSLRQLHEEWWDFLN